MAIANATIEAELGLSDFEFKRQYIEKNRKWWGEHYERHKGLVHCAGCNGEIRDPADLRPLGGVNYDARCFRKHAYAEATSVRGFNTPENCLATEWMLKISRVMDRVTLLGE